MKWLMGTAWLTLAMVLGMVAAVLLMSGSAWAVSQGEQDLRVSTNGTANAFTEVSCSGASTSVLTGTQTANGIRMHVRNIDATNVVTLCPGVTCPNAAAGWTLAVSSATVYVPPLELGAVRGVTFTCFPAAGTPIIEVWLEKTE
jgi:hypothetical protein